MKRLVFLGVAAALATALVGSRAGAAAPPPPGPTPTVPASPVFRVNFDSSYKNAEVNPSVQSTRFRGTMDLALLPTMQPGNFPLYRVENVNWLVSTDDGQEVYVCGTGTYRVWPSVGMLTVIGHEMRLDLKWGNDQTNRTFVSGIVPMPNYGSSVQNVSITLREISPVPENPAAVIELRAARVPARQIKPYVLTNESSFAEGCFAPCTCPVSQTPTAGTFGVVVLPPAPTALPPAPEEYAFVRLNARVPLVQNAMNPPVTRTLKGAGIYRLFRSDAPGALPVIGQRLQACVQDINPLVLPLVPLEVFFDSDVQPVTVQWPRVSVSISDNEMFCWNRVLNLVARPARVLRPSFEPVPGPGPFVGPADSPRVEPTSK